MNGDWFLVVFFLGVMLTIFGIMGILADLIEKWEKKRDRKGR